jgi:hypothetical protein
MEQLDSHITYPSHYDSEYIREKVAPAYYGFANEPDGQTTKFSVPARFYDALLDVVNSYQLAYREVLLPRSLDELSRLRDSKIASFQFQGMTIPMDRATRGDLGDLISGLERNRQRTHSTWSLGGGEFVKMPRDAVFALGDAAFNYVQDCFEAHEAIAQALKAAATVDDLRAIDLDQHEAWPA